MSLSNSTRRMVAEIRTKVKSKITKQHEFKDADEVIDAAVEMFYNQLKKERHL